MREHIVLGILAHVDAGKTTLSEALLYQSGARRSLGRVDHRDAYLESSQEAFALVHAVNSPCVKVLFDIYHQQVSEGDILTLLLPHLDKVGHLHAAAVPGRAALLGGELDYPTLLARIAAAGYEGCVGLEYFPQQWTEGVAADLPAVLKALHAVNIA